MLKTIEPYLIKQFLKQARKRIYSTKKVSYSSFAKLGEIKAIKKLTFDLMKEKKELIYSFKKVHFDLTF